MREALALAPFLMLISFGILLFIMPSNKKRETRILFGCYFILKAFLSIFFTQSVVQPNVEVEAFRFFLDAATTITLYFGFFSLIFPAKKLFKGYLPLLVGLFITSSIYVATIASYSPEEQQAFAQVLWKQNSADPRFPAVFHARNTLGYLALALILYFQTLIVVFGFKFRKYVRNNYSYTEQISLKFFIYLEIFLLSSIIMDTLLVSVTRDATLLPYTIYTFAFAFSVYFLIANDKVLENKLLASQFIAFVEQMNRKLIFVALPIAEKKDKHIPEVVNDPLRDKLIQYFKENKPYISKKLTINDIAKPLNSNRTYISQLINSDFDTTFFHFVNVFRIEEAKKQLEKAPNYSMKTIADSCGFSSYTTFAKYYKMYKESTTNWYKDLVVKVDTPTSCQENARKRE